MTQEQEDKFEKFFAEDPLAVSGIKENQYIGWAACLEANGIGDNSEKPNIPEGYFKIGEEVEIYNGVSWESGSVIAWRYKSGIVHGDPVEVRRIPAWKPKEGEAVLVCYEGTDMTIYAIAASQYEIYTWDRDTGERMTRDAEMKPFDASKIGKPWSDL